MNHYKIRNSRKKDTDALIALSRKTINHSFRPFMGDVAVDGFINSGMADKEITDAIDHLLVLEFENRIIGFCIWKDDLLHLIMIDPNFQGTGAAHYFIATMCDEKLKQYGEIYLECFEDNAKANAFYQKNGWEVYKKEADADLGWNRLFYRKRT